MTRPCTVSKVPFVPSGPQTQKQPLTTMKPLSPAMTCCPTPREIRWQERLARVAAAELILTKNTEPKLCEKKVVKAKTGVNSATFTPPNPIFSSDEKKGPIPSVPEEMGLSASDPLIVPHLKGHRSALAGNSLSPSKFSASRLNPTAAAIDSLEFPDGKSGFVSYGGLPDVEFRLRHYQRNKLQDTPEEEKSKFVIPEKDDNGSYKKPKLAFPPASDKARWKALNEELCAALPLLFPKDTMATMDLSKLSRKFDNWLYLFFEQRCGVVEPGSGSGSGGDRKTRKPVVNKRMAHLRKRKRELKKMRKNLLHKGLKGSPEEQAMSILWFRLIREHSKLSRSLRQKNTSRVSAAAEARFLADPYKFANNLFNPMGTGKPAFTKEEAEQYFVPLYHDQDRSKEYEDLPGSTPPPVPNHVFNVKCPSYNDIRRSVRKKSNKASPGLNGLTYLPYKKCPALLSWLFKLCKRVWQEKKVPDDWAQAYVVLLSKSDDLKSPGEFRPIAVTNTSGKIFFSVVSDRLQLFMVENVYIDKDIQKGFLTGVAGCVEHSFALMEALRDARAGPRQIVITWIDLANAYGSVRHNLIQYALDWYHVPKEVQALIFDYYEKLMATVTTSDWSTNFFLFDIGLFQGCVLSTILFDCVFQLLLDFLKPLNKLGYKFKRQGCKDVSKLAQAYADDLALTTRNAKDNQKVCDRAVMWLDWTITMKAKPRKCVSLALKGFDTRIKDEKFVPEWNTSYSAFNPNLTINGEPVRFIMDQKMKPGLERHFKFLGTWINSKLSNQQVKEHIRKSLMSDMKLIDERSHVNGVMKLWMYQHQVITRIAWPFLIQDLDLSFTNTLQSNISVTLKAWLGINSRADIGRLFLSRPNSGLGLTSISDQYKQMQIIKHQLLKHSADDDIRTLLAAKDTRENPPDAVPRIWKASTHSAKAESAAKHELKFPHQSDRLGLGHGRFNNDPNPKEWRKLVLGQHKLFTQEKYLAHSHQLPRQGVWTKWKDQTETVDLSWHNLIYSMSPRLVKFVANAMINMVLTPDLMQLYQWSTHATCALCKHSNCTLHHILVNCDHSLYAGRYTWRHDSVLRGLDLALSAHIQMWNAAKPRSRRFPALAVSFAKGATGSRLPRACLLDGARDWEISVDYDRAVAPFPADICLTSQRPDIAIWSRSLRKVLPIELTCPGEEGIQEAKIRKEAKYNKDLVPLIKRSGWSVTLMTVEVGARGCPGLTVRRCLRRIGLSNTMAGTVVKAVSLTAARCSLVLYQFREIPEWNRKRALFTGAYGKLRPTPVFVSKLVESKNKTKPPPSAVASSPSTKSSVAPSPSVASNPSTPSSVASSPSRPSSVASSPSTPSKLAESKNKTKTKQKTNTPSSPPPSSVVSSSSTQSFVVSRSSTQSSTVPSPSTPTFAASRPSTPVGTRLPRKQIPSTDMSPSMPLSLFNNDQYKNQKKHLLSPPHFSNSSPFTSPTVINTPSHNNRRRSGLTSSNRRFSLHYSPQLLAAAPPPTLSKPPSPLLSSFELDSFLRERKLP
jgi:hypothetical protein